MKRSIPCCHACGRALPKPKAPTAVSGPVDTSTMSIPELFAHYKRLAPLEDLRFLLLAEMSAELRSRIATALTNAKAPTPKDVSALRDAWRMESAAADRAAGRPFLRFVAVPIERTEEEKKNGRPRYRYVPAEDVTEELEATA